MNEEELAGLHFLKSYVRAYNEWNIRSAQTEMTADHLYNLILNLTGDEDKASTAHANKILAEEKLRWRSSQGKTF